MRVLNVILRTRTSKAFSLLQLGHKLGVPVSSMIIEPPPRCLLEPRQPGPKLFVRARFQIRLPLVDRFRLRLKPACSLLMAATRKASKELCVDGRKVCLKLNVALVMLPSGGR